MEKKQGATGGKDESPTMNSCNNAYMLPNWFLQHNVKTSENLATTPDQISFCNCNDCKDTRLDEDPDGVSEKNEPVQARDEVHYKTFSELRDVICASFMPSHNEKLRRQGSTIVFRMEKDGTSLLEPAWMSRVVVQVAKACKGVSMISFGLETLEELGCEFHQQDKDRAAEEESTTEDWKPDMKSFTTFLEHFFDIRSRAYAGREAWKRNQDVLSTLLDAVKVKQTERPETIKGYGPDAVLIHIMDCPLVDQAVGSVVKERAFTRIAEMVRTRRDRGEAVAILLSTKCPSYVPGQDRFNSIGGTVGSTVTAPGGKILDWDWRTAVRTGIINTQRMRRLMRHLLHPDLFCPNLLAFHSNCASGDRAQTYKSLGEKLWSPGDVEKAVTLLAGRGWRISKGRSQLSFSDIRAVLKCLGLFHIVKSAPADSKFYISTSPEFMKISKLCRHRYG